MGKSMANPYRPSPFLSTYSCKIIPGSGWVGKKKIYWRGVERRGIMGVARQGTEKVELEKVG